MEYHKLVMPSVSYYARALAEYLLVSDLLWEMDRVPLPDGCFVTVSYDSIRIYNLDKQTYHSIIEALSLDIGEKMASSTNITAKFKVDKIDVIFVWDLPESCEVVYEEVEIPEDEIVRTKKTVKEIICKEPLMQSVFPDWVEEENGVAK